MRTDELNMTLIMSNNNNINRHKREVSIATINCKNIKANYLYINKLMSTNQIIFIKEHWLNIHEIKNMGNYIDLQNYLFNTHMDSSFDTIEKGRPFGGIGWIIHKDIKIESVEFINNKFSILKIAEGPTLIGVYMQYNDGSTEAFQSHMQDVIQLDSIISIYDNRPTMVMGDVNADLSRNKKFDKILQKLVKDKKLTVLELEKLRESEQPIITYRGDNGSNSWIDHILCNDRILDQIHDCKIEEHSMNTSDHSAVTCSLVIDTSENNNSKVDQHQHEKMKAKQNMINWDDEMSRYYYTKNVNEKVKQVCLLSLSNSNTKIHKISAIERNIDIIKQILTEAYTKTANEMNQKITKVKRRSWWSEEFDNIKKEISYHYQEWKRSRRTDSEAERQMRMWKRIFRKRQREEKFKERTKVSNKLDTLIKLKRRQFWAQIKKNRVGKVSVNIPMEVLKQEYEKLFGEDLVKGNEKKENEIEMEVQQEIERLEDRILEYKINRETMSKIIKQIPNNKGIGQDNISNEMLKYGMSGKLNEMWCKTLEDMIKNGIVPRKFKVGKIVPILKLNTGPTDNINNIRPITSDSLSNIFEKYILQSMNDQIKLKENQFGFTKSGSTQHGVFVIKEVANYYKTRKSNMYICAIDSSKAFDKVWRKGLFQKLRNVISEAEWRILIRYYEKSLCYISFQNQHSELFVSKVGVKQGGPLSPTLYNIYVKDLIPLIEELKLGAIINEMSVSIVMYADDVMLISPTKKGLILMLKKAYEFLTEWKVKVNVGKTSYMIIGTEKTIDKPIKIGSENIERTKEMKYLGVILNEQLSMRRHVENRTSQSAKAAYSLYSIGLMNTAMKTNTKRVIYSTYCRPSMLYGCEFIDISEPILRQIRKDECILMKKNFIGRETK